MPEWDEAKRLANIEKHGLDFDGADAGQPNMKHTSTSRAFPVDPAAIRAVIDAAPERVDDPECPYNPNDQTAVEAFWQKAVVRRPGQRGPGKKARKVTLSIRLDPDIVEFFKARGAGWQSRINQALREVIEKR